MPKIAGPTMATATPSKTGAATRSSGKIDARQRIICDNLKNARDAQNRPMYTIYTIQANTTTPADPTSAILQYCASSPDKFYEPTNSNEIRLHTQATGCNALSFFVWTRPQSKIVQEIRVSMPRQHFA